MVHIQYLSHDRVVATFPGIRTFDQTVGTVLIQRLVPFLQENIHVVLDMEGIDLIDSKGYGKLSSFHCLALKNNCTVYFWNVDDYISEIIHEFKSKEEA